MRTTIPAFLLVAASLVLLVCDSLGMELTFVGYRVADDALLIGALCSLILALSGAESSSGAASGGGAFFAGAFAALAPVAAIWMRYLDLPPYPVVASAFLGSSLFALATALATGEDRDRSTSLPAKEGLTFTLVAATACTLLALSHSSAWAWILAPAYVLFAPGLGIGAAVFPQSTGRGEWFLWAPLLSTSVQVLALLWLDVLGVPVSPALIIALAGAFTLVGVVGARFR